MRRGLIPLDVHAAIEPIMAIVLIAAPWIFGFSDVNSAKVVSIIVGVIMLVAGSMTQWRLSLVKLIPLRLHLMTDLVLGAFLILSPFIFGVSHNGAATRFMIIYGAIELLTAVSTRWEPDDVAARKRRGDRRGVATAR
jgi:hypothetical protein